jgi:23S rRNA (guanosine2251-2'-O)-methyltransferase
MIKSKNLIFGTRAAIEALRSGKDIEKVLIKKEPGGEAIGELMKCLRESSVPYQYVPVDKLNRLTQKNHQGIIAIISEIEYQPVEQVIPFLYEKGEVPFILVLDHITDVRNFGSIARTAECAGVHAIVIPDKGAAGINADAVKTSSGALLNISVCRVTNLVKTIKFLSDSGIQIIAASEKAEDLYDKPDYKIPTAIIMGAEDKGISQEIIKMSDNFVKIPVFGKVKSLNVSVAAGLMLYEVVKQRSLHKS